MDLKDRLPHFQRLKLLTHHFGHALGRLTALQK